MRPTFAAVLLALTASATWAQERAPEPKPGSLFRPTIHADGQARRAGHAFPVSWRAGGDEPRPLVLTCLHLFGPAGGLPRQLDGAALAGAVERLELADAFGRAATVTVRRALALPGSFPADDERGPGGDLAAFDCLRVVSTASGAPRVTRWWARDVGLVRERVEGGSGLDLVHVRRGDG
ncbi:MAG: hypothetical protein KF878_07990 [Planctomycetes bacterium]|nr:hypothetical protein [Planctomycetota bacterium]